MGTTEGGLLLGPVLRHVGPTHATVWVEVDRPCAVQVAGAATTTFTVAGHHYALVVVDGLTPGSVTEYDVRLDGVPVWPPADQPPGRIRTPAEQGPVRVAFGSCRYATPRALGSPGRYGPDALDALSRRLHADPDAVPPDLLLLLGDQVYADETTAEVRRRILERRGGDTAPQGQVRDYEEYTWLYHESWRDPEVRRLLADVPTAMIFDDHDVHDDWNTSGSWRADAARESWWPERIVAGLASYWVYQHLGNLSPAELDADPTWQRVRALPPGEDAEPLLRELAVRADAEADGAKGYRWSFRRDLGRTRVVVLDSRCGRLLDGDRRDMLGESDWAWLADQLRLPADGGIEHVLVGTSLPWLLAPALHHLEAWDEQLAADPRPRRAALGERLRRGADLEHWAAFGASFDRLAELLDRLARGALGPAPACVAVLSGDVHHSYLCRAHWPAPRATGTAAAAAPVYQVTCSPLHNRLPVPYQWGFRLAWTRAAGALTRLLLRRPVPALRWDRTGGPWFGNMLGTLELHGRQARLRMEVTADRGLPLGTVTEVELAG